MLQHLPSSFALLGLGGAELFGVILPIFGLLFAAVITIAAMYFRSQERDRWHQTARIALEKGQPLPPIGREDPHERPNPASDGVHPNHDIRGGMVLIAVGAGLWLLLGAIAGQLRYVGAIPGFIGVALLLFALGRALFGGKPDRHDRPPQS